MTLLRIPPPQLHLHLGIPNLVMDVIILLWGLEEVLAWAKRNYIMRRGYHGGQFDGNNAKKILERLDDLEASCPSSCAPLVHLLRSFKPIVSGCFGQSLDPSFHELISSFKTQFLKTQQYVAGLESNIRLNVTWKVHTLIVHLPQFLEMSGCGLARYSEQCGESVHHIIKKVLARFKLEETHPKHGERFKRAVVEFSTERL